MNALTLKYVLLVQRDVGKTGTIGQSNNPNQLAPTLYKWFYPPDLTIDYNYYDESPRLLSSWGWPTLTSSTF